MRSTSFAIELVETGYRLDGTAAEWLERVLARLDGVIGHGHGVIGIVYRIVGARFEVEHIGGHACPSPLVAFCRSCYENAPQEIASTIRASKGELASFSEFARALAPEHAAAYRDALGAYGLTDCLMIGFPFGVDSGLVFAALSSVPLRTFQGQRRIWRRIGAHLAAAWCLHQRRTEAATAIAAQVIDPRELSARERAVVELVWTGASNKHVASTLGIDAATVGHHLARALKKLGIASRAELLVRGRARRTANELPLSESELAIAELAAGGRTTAEIARVRGRSTHTIANQLACIYEKLGIGSRAQLVVALHRR